MCLLWYSDQLCLVSLIQWVILGHGSMQFNGCWPCWERFSNILGLKNYHGKHGLGWHLSLLRCQHCRMHILFLEKTINLLGTFANYAQNILKSVRGWAYISFASMAKAACILLFQAEENEQTLPSSLEGRLCPSTCYSYLYLSSDVSVNYDWLRWTGFVDRIANVANPILATMFVPS